jgi:hypothetical protein
LRSYARELPWLPCSPSSYEEDVTCLPYSYAEDVTRMPYYDKSYANKKASKLVLFHELYILVKGLCKCFDPCVRPLEKAYYCGKPFCIVAGFTAGYLVEKTTPGSQKHRIALVCLESFCKAYHVLSNKFL